MRSFGIGVAVALSSFGCANGSSGTGTTGGSSGTTGGPATCGAQNFDVICATGRCPSSSACVSPSGCHCDPGYIDVNCAGEACEVPGANCAGDAQNYWCTPRVAGACGPINFDVPCGDAGAYCPANSTCLATKCVCASAFTDLSCEGTPCSLIDGGCDSAVGDYWCAPLQSGACGPQNFTVACSTDTGESYNCPSDSSCSASGCLCVTPNVPQACDGTSCEDGGCPYPNWWCTPP